MESPRRSSGSRAATLVWAVTVLSLLVLPPALSTGQQASAPADDPAAPVTADPPAAPPPNGQPEGGGQGGQQDEPAAPAPQPTSAPAGDEAAVSSQSEKQAKPAASQTVSVGDNFYSPRSITIDVGDTVTWANNGNAQHSATANDGSFDTGVFGPGASRSHTFNTAGTFDYFCTVHGQSQSGTVTVASTGGGGGGGGQSEAAAVASEDAAGTSTSLPSTGADVLPPMVVGLLLLIAGLAIRFRDWFGPA